MIFNYQITQSIVKRFFSYIALAATPFIFGSWGFFAHKLINHSAVFSLPVELAAFYKAHIEYISEQAVAPDRRCYVDTLESPRHYIDLEDLGDLGEITPDEEPLHWSSAVALFTERKLRAAGIIPWQIEITYGRLREAMYAKDLARILRHAADLGHYVSDAHVPLHTTRNYNGQFTNQRGIHAFWETRLPERFAKEYDLWVGRAMYIPSALEEAWIIVRESHALVDSVLLLEQTLSNQYSPDQKYAYVLRNNILHRTYSETYARAYHDTMNGMVERRMRASIRRTASFWYSAWVDAGQPDLSDLANPKLVPADTAALPTGTQPRQKILGREEWH